MPLYCPRLWRDGMEHRQWSCRIKLSFIDMEGDKFFFEIELIN
jgi:hypothetical protein